MLTGCEPGAQLTVENQMTTEITVMSVRINESGTATDTATLGTVPPEQTLKLPAIFPLRPDIIGRTILIKTLDPSGNIVWQKSWTFEEFKKLKDVGWKIVVSPETNA